MFERLMDREKLDRWCEQGILGLVLAILVFGPLAFGAVDTVPFLVIQGLSVGVLLLWGARLWVSPRPQLIWPPISWAVVAFALYAVIRYFTADIEYLARQELIGVLVYAFLFLAILNNLHRQETIQIISLTLIFLAMAISCYAIYQFVTDSKWVWNYPRLYRHRGSGTYISPNHLGGFLEMLLPLGLAYTLAGRSKPLLKVFVGYASLVVVAGIAVTVSRGAWISTILALLVFFGMMLIHGRHRLGVLALLAVLIFAGIFVAPKSMSFQARTRQLVAGGKIDDDKRFTLWQPAFRLWQENFWLGVGPAHFDFRFRSYRPEDVQQRPELVHNDYLNTVVDWGLVGGVLVLSAWVLLGVGVMKTWPSVKITPRDIGEKKSSNKFAFVMGACAGLAAILFHSVVDFNMHIPANAIVAVTLMAMLSSHLRFATERYWLSAGTALKAAATVMLAGGSIFLGWQAWQKGVENAYLSRAAEAPPFSPLQVNSLKEAYGVDPRNAQTAYSIGEGLRVQSLAGGEDYRKLAEEALEWFKRSQKLNRWDSRGFLNYGLCLDWLERTEESGPYFVQAEQLDPNGYFTIASTGLHYVQMGDYAAARPWFERSLRLQNEGNILAHNYLQIANERLMEAATNEIRAKLMFPRPRP